MAEDSAPFWPAALCGNSTSARDAILLNQADANAFPCAASYRTCLFNAMRGWGRTLFKAHCGITIEEEEDQTGFWTRLTAVWAIEEMSLRRLV